MFLFVGQNKPDRQATLAMTKRNPQTTRGQQKNRHTDIDDLVRSRIDQLISESPNDDYASVSSLLGKNHAYIQQYIKRHTPRNLREEDRRLIAEHFRVPDMLYVGARKSAPRPGDTPDSGTARMRASHDTIWLPVLSNPVADRSVLLDNSSDQPDPAAVQPSMGFSRSLLAQLAGSADHHTLILTSVRGSAMTPTLSDGDMMLVMANRKAPLRDGVFAIYSEGLIVPKRIMVHPGGTRVTLSNDNPLYGHGVVCQLDELEVLGRIIWCGRRL